MAAFLASTLRWTSRPRTKLRPPPPQQPNRGLEVSLLSKTVWHHGDLRRKSKIQSDQILHQTWLREGRSHYNRRQVGFRSLIPHSERIWVGNHFHYNLQIRMRHGKRSHGKRSWWQDGTPTSWEREEESESIKKISQFQSSILFCITIFANGFLCLFMWYFLVQII